MGFTVSEEVVEWVVVPGGTDGDGNLQLSVVVVPQLTPAAGGGATMSNFYDFADWPARIGAANFAFAVTFTDNTGVHAPVRILASTVTATPPDSTVWQALFPADFEVEARSAADNPSTTTTYVSPPLQTLGDLIVGQWATLPKNDAPTFQQVQSSSQYAPLTNGHGGITAEERIANLQQARLQPDASGNVSYVNQFDVNADPADAVALHLEYFHVPPPQPVGGGGEPTDLGPLPPTPPTLDFHGALTFVGEHATLQRALGLVIDISVPISQVELSFLASANPGAGEISVTVEPVIAGDGNVQGPYPFGSANTLYRSVYVPTLATYDTTTSPATFEAWCPSGDGYFVSGGQLQNVELFYPYTFDLVGGVFRAASFAAAIAAQDPDLLEQIETRALQDWRPPPLTSSGFALAVSGRADLFQRGLLRQQELSQLYEVSAEGGTLPGLQATDLTRGLILDVFDASAYVDGQQTGKWYSTNLRSIQYSSPQGSFNTISAIDEGGVTSPPRVGTTEDGVGNQVPAYFLSEEILHYDNWSNAAQRPANALTDSDAAAGDPGTGQLADRIAITTSPAPGTLPRLRFGKKYALRVRVVDLAGNVVPVDDAGTEGAFPVANGALKPISYGRLEPISAPDVLAQNGSPAGYPIPGESVARLAIGGVDNSVSSSRVLAPPRCTVAFAEVHGMWDTGPASADGSHPTTLDPNAYGVFNAQVPDWTSQSSSTTTPPTKTIGRESGQYPLPPATWGVGIDVTQPVPYLPDPLSRGGVLAVTTSNLALAGQSVSFDFSPASGKSWPDCRPVLLKLAPVGSGKRGLTYNAASRTVTVALAPGDRIHASFSSICNVADVSAYDLGSFLPATVTSQADFAATVAAGDYWSVTPQDALEFLYAVQQPLFTPEFPLLVAERDSSVLTDVYLSGSLSWDPVTTGGLEVTCTFTDPVDEPSAGAPAALALAGVPGIIAGPGVPGSAPLPSRTPQVWSFPGGFADVSYDPLLPPTDLETPGSSGFSQKLTQSFNGIRHQVGDTKAHLVTYQAVAASSYSEFYPGANPDSLQVSTADPIQVQIPSSVPPASLSVAYVVPIYDWSEDQPSNTQIVSERSPAGLRVFLERPWWSSGNGELLGVVTGPDTGGAPFDPATGRFVSDWGNDPVFASGGDLPTVHPTTAAFTAATVIPDGGVKPQEDPTTIVGVAGHAVSFDPTLNLWYADIKIDTGQSYTPMVRLALARYQPNSVATFGVELGRISLLDIFTLDPGRTATVEQADGAIKVTLTGLSYRKAATGQSAGTNTSGPGPMQVLLQSRDTSISDPDIGWTAVSAGGITNPVSAAGTIQPNGTATWTATLDIPTSATYRLVVSQYEVLPTDSRDSSALGGTQDGYRLVHQDVIPLGVRRRKVVITKSKRKKHRHKPTATKKKRR